MDENDRRAVAGLERAHPSLRQLELPSVAERGVTPDSLVVGHLRRLLVQLGRAWLGRRHANSYDSHTSGMYLTCRRYVCQGAALGCPATWRGGAGRPSNR